MRLTLLFLLITTTAMCFAQSEISNIEKKYHGFSLVYSSADSSIVSSIATMISQGNRIVTDYFNHPFKQDFKARVFASRHDLDVQWQKDFHDTTFHSECWMVAAGDGNGMSILSPIVWKEQSCEHNPNDTLEMKRVLTHELVHVYHGQYNPNHDFAGLDSLAWFVEGLATFVSGQYDEKRIQQVKNLISQNKEPNQLKNFWTGKERYALAGSMIAFINTKYGKEKVFELLSQTDQKEMLKMLNTTEAQLIVSWKKSIQ